MQLEARHFRLAAVALCFFLATQAFQALCFHLWLPETQQATADYAMRLGWLERTRALTVLSGILALSVPYAIVAIDRFPNAPLASLLGFSFTLFFILFELLQRGLDFALVSQQWANAFAAATEPALRDLLLQRHASWGALTGALYFPLLLSGLLAWTCFAVATWNAGPGWQLASIALSLNALRTLARMLAVYGGVTWFDFLNGLTGYLVLVFAINGMLALWLFQRAAAANTATTADTTLPGI